MPTLSIILPTYNDALLLQRAIEAVLRQSYQDFELIIVDDASQDQTENLVQTYLKDSRIRYFRNSKNLGAAEAYKLGCGYCQGGYLYMASSNDWVNDGFFETGIKALQRYPEVGICFFDFLYVKGKDQTRKKFLNGISQETYLSPQAMWNIQKSHYFHLSGTSVIAKKSELLKKEYPAETGYFCDMITCSAVALQTGAIYIPQIASFYTVGENGHRMTRKFLLKQGSQVLTYLKKDRALFKKLCYSTILPKSLHYSLYTLFLRPKHWDMLFPMVWVKLGLLYPKVMNGFRKTITKEQRAPL